MAPRAYWTGNIKISLVSFGVRLYNVVTEAERVRLNQVHKGCNQRIKMPTTCPVHGQVERSEIAKAYEFEKDKYVIIEQEELDRIKLRSEKTIELSKFVKLDSVDDVYFDGSYYAAPDGPVADEPYRIFLGALEKTGMAGIGKITLNGRERPILLRPGGKGFVLNTLFAANEVRSAEPYFEEVASGEVRKDYMDLAVSLIKGNAGDFNPAKFRDRYQDALVELVKSKIAGEEPVVIQEDDVPTTFNFADALRQSLAGVGMTPAAPIERSEPSKATVSKGVKKPPARSEPAAAKKTGASGKSAKRKQA